MLAALGRFVYRRRVAVAAASVIFLVVAGAAGAGVVPELSPAGFTTDDVEAADAARALHERFDAGAPNLLLLITSKSGSVDDPAVVLRGAELTQDLAAEPEVEQAYSYWSLGSPALKGKDGRQALILARLEGGEEEVMEAAQKLALEYELDEEFVQVGIGGPARVFSEISHQVEKDLQKAELITFPIILVLLIIVFGSAVAAGLPLGVGMLAVVGTLVVLRILAAFTDVSIFSLNLTTGLGLGLGIDYSLFIVSRFREELGSGATPERAVVRSVETAGRTVLFSALTVAASLVALLAFPVPIMHSFAYAGSAVVLVAAAGSLVSLPAVLGILGNNVNRFRLVEQRPAPAEGQEFWGRMARVVMRRPVPIALAITALLLFLGAPFLNATFGVWDDRVLGERADSRRVQDQVRANFSAGESGAVAVVVEGTGGPAERAAEVGHYAAQLSTLKDVQRVDAETGSYAGGQQVAPPLPGISQRFSAAGATWLSVVPSVEPISADAETLVTEIRRTPAPGEVLVGGQSADLLDGKTRLFERLPLALTVIVVVTAILLFLMTGSVLIPIKAMILNLLSLAATFGAMVWIFQDGNLSDLLNFTPTGALDTMSPILMFCVAFGLSMDYEVFLLSRIKEEHDAGADNVTAVARGLERTGPIVTAAAGLLAVVFLAFLSSEVAFIKLIGIGMMLAVLMDATLIRATLVPAFMRLAGNANWWAPGPMRRFHDRFGFRESVPPAPAFNEGS